MKNFSRDEIYQQLGQEITHPSFLLFFNGLKKRRVFRPFPDPSALVRFIQEPSPDNPIRQDLVVGALIRLYQKSKRPVQRKKILTLLLLGLRPKMEQTLHYSTRRLRFLQADPFSEVYAAYLCRISDLEEPDRLGAISHLQDKADQFVRETVREECRYRQLLKRLKEIGYNPPKSVDYSKAEDMLSDWVAQGVITEAEKELIREYVINERPFNELSQELGHPAHTLYMRYWRAIDRLREFLKDKVRWDRYGRPYMPK